MAKRSFRMSPNRSSRNGVRVDQGLIHTTEGSYESAINWFMNPAAKASAHDVVATNGDFTTMVPHTQAAWTAGGGPIPLMNSRSYNIELAGFASQGNKFWRHLRKPQLHTAAKLMAEQSLRYGFKPVRKVPGGIAGHVNVSGPGGHSDPGKGFPWKTFLLLVRLYRLRKQGARPALQKRWRRIVMERLAR